MADTLLQQVTLDERGLIASIIQDASTGEVIGFYELDRATLASYLRKGEASMLSVDGLAWSYPLIDVRINSDGKSLTVLVQRTGEKDTTNSRSIMHKGSEASKAFEPGVSLVDVGTMEFGLTIGELFSLISERKENRPEGSYTSYLFNSGLDKILKKISEESGEVIIAAKNNSAGNLINELADLFYHLLVLMVERSVLLSDVGAELNRRAAARSIRSDES